MMKKAGWIVVLLFMTLTTQLVAQDMRPLWEGAAFGELLDDLQARSDDPASAQALATLYTYMGRQDLAYEIEGRLPWPNSACVDQSSVAELVPAAETILAETEDRRLVLFNENHFWIAPRAFLRRLLPSLREQGFTHMGFEVFGTETAIREREGRESDENWRFDPSQGSYSHEPVFSALIRDARELGFEIFGYESHAEAPESASMRERIKLRERTQAKNILSEMNAADETARFVIFAGWSHIAKTPVGMPDGDGLWMAGQLMEMTDIEPLSIELARCASELTDETTDSSESALEAVIPLDDERVFMVGGHYPESVDMQVHLPIRKTGEHAAGFYRQTLGQTVAIPRALQATEHPVLVRAWREGQPVESVPVDQIWLRPDEQLPLYLPAGAEYRLTAFDGDGNEMASTRVRVKH